MKKLMLILSLFLLLPAPGVVHAEIEQPRIRISEVKLGGAIDGQPTEFVELFNDTDVAVDLTAYQLEYAKPTAQLATTDCAGVNAWGSIDATSAVKTTALSGTMEPRGRLLFEPSLNDNLDASLRLVHSDGANLVVDDLVGWGVTALCSESAQATKPVNTKSIKRLFDSDGHPVDTDNNATDFDQPGDPFPEVNQSPTDNSTPNDPPPATPTCQNDVTINELESDPIGLEADGGEFVELYNPSDTDAVLSGCTLASSKYASPIVTFTDSDTILSHGYFVYNLTDKLTNANGSVTYTTDTREDVVTYSNMHEGEAMAFFTTGWEVTNQPTPLAANLHYLEATDGTIADVSTTLSPCPDGKYRNPDTNRCKSIVVAVTALTPCDDGEYRNPDTNRCKKITTASTALTPCDAGQERNPDTNRCRKVATTTLTACKDGYERNPDTNRCRKVSVANAVAEQSADTLKNNSIRLSGWVIFATMTAAIGYGAYEYRQEASQAYQKVRSKFDRSGPKD